MLKSSCFVTFFQKLVFLSFEIYTFHIVNLVSMAIGWLAFPNTVFFKSFYFCCCFDVDELIFKNC